MRFFLQRLHGTVAIKPLVLCCALLCSRPVLADAISFQLASTTLTTTSGGTVVFQGTVTNDSGGNENASDFSFNFFGFDLNSVAPTQVLGLTDFAIPNQSTSASTSLFSITVGNVAPGLSFPVNVFLQDSAGNQTAAQTVYVVTQAGGATISAVVNGASFLPGISASTWITIAGTNLSQTTRTWKSSDFVNNTLPTQLDGVSAKVNGIPAYVYYISPTQLNVLAPDDTTIGQVQVQVTNAQGTSTNFAANKVEFSPAFFLFTAKYPAAVHTSGAYVGPKGLIAGANFAPAKPGETILLFGTGFGPTNPALPAGKLVTSAAPLANKATVTIGGKPAKVLFAGLSGSGLDQLNVTLPADLPNGDAALVATVGGVSTQANLVITVKQ